MRTSPRLFQHGVCCIATTYPLDRVNPA